jgi:beta-lactamase class A
VTALAAQERQAGMTAWSTVPKTLLVIALLALPAAFVIGLPRGSQPTTETAQAQIVPVPQFYQQHSADYPVDAQLQSEIEDYLTGLEGRYGVAIRNLDDGRTVRVNASERLEAASMYKLLVMYRTFQQIESGDLQMSDILTVQEEDTLESSEYDLMPGEVVTVEEALELMISVSSNSAAYALARTVGGWSVIDSAAEEIGMLATHWDDGYWSTPDDMLRFFEALADRELVSRDASDRMVELLLEQEVRDRIPALLPDYVLVAHKTGELDNVRNDGGIVSSPGGRYVIVVMSYDVDPSEATEAIAEMSRLVYERYG